MMTFLALGFVVTWVPRQTPWEHTGYYLFWMLLLGACLLPSYLAVRCPGCRRNPVRASLGRAMGPQLSCWHCGLELADAKARAEHERIVDRKHALGPFVRLLAGATSAYPWLFLAVTGLPKRWFERS